MRHAPAMVGCRTNVITAIEVTKGNANDCLEMAPLTAKTAANGFQMAALFGGALRSKLFTSQVNEVLLKALCHNLAVLVHEIHELGVEAEFWN